MEILNSSYKGTKIRVGNVKAYLIMKYMNYCIEEFDATYMEMPIINSSEVFKDKVGPENNNMMYHLSDRKGRDLCLAPEYTAVVQKLALKEWKQRHDFPVFYIQECFRGETPQLGRFRQFTQLGFEVIRPRSIDISPIALEIILDLFPELGGELVVETVERGLDYYKEGIGFEITLSSYPKLSICGGGAYEGGAGFSIGLDRILSLLSQK